MVLSVTSGFREQTAAIDIGMQSREGQNVKYASERQVSPAASGRQNLTPSVFGEPTPADPSASGEGGESEGLGYQRNCPVAPET